jgi:hypothetical protein
MSRANADFKPAWPAARNPIMRAPVTAEQRVHIAMAEQLEKTARDLNGVS